MEGVFAEGAPLLIVIDAAEDPLHLGQADNSDDGNTYAWCSLRNKVSFRRVAIRFPFYPRAPFSRQEQRAPVPAPGRRRDRVPGSRPRLTAPSGPHHARHAGYSRHREGGTAPYVMITRGRTARTATRGRRPCAARRRSRALNTAYPTRRVHGLFWNAH